MECNNCKSMDSISLAAHETIMAREDKKHRRLVWVIVVLIAALVVCNLAWLVTWNNYDFVSEDYDYSQDGRGINIIGNDNEAEQYGTEITDTP